MEEEGTLVRGYGSYRLYFKGLVRKEKSGLLAGFGVAFCDQDDKLIFQMKGPIHGLDITDLEAELTAMKQGLTKAVELGFGHISIFCHHYQIFELVMERSMPVGYNLTLLMNDVQRIRKQLKSSIPVLGTGYQTMFVNELAMGGVVSDEVSSIHMPTTCLICFDDDLEAKQMFSGALCGHQFCVKCMKRHIEARLVMGSVPRCPSYQCKSKLDFGRCVNLLTPKLKETWVRRIEEESILVADRVYCPNPWCSTLMSKTKLSKSTQEAGGRRDCVKCGKPFCINCKVPWHNNLSCNNYKRLGPNPTTNDIKLIALADQKLWRQCEKCKHMIEMWEGCIKLTCRCGYSFCYTCGTEWKQGGCRHRADMHTCFIFTVVLIVVLILVLRSCTK